MGSIDPSKPASTAAPAARPRSKASPLKNKSGRSNYSSGKTLPVPSARYITSVILLVGITLFLATFVGFSQKLITGCVPIDNPISQMGYAAFGITIGMIVNIIFTFVKPLLCLRNGLGFIIFLLFMAALLIIAQVFSMAIYSKTDDNCDNPPCTANDGESPASENSVGKLKSMFLNNVFFLGIGIGILYAIALNLISLAVGNRPLLILTIIMIPLLIFCMIFGIMVITKWKKKNPNWETEYKTGGGLCTEYQPSQDLDLSGIANLFTTITEDQEKPKPAPYIIVLIMTIISGGSIVGLPILTWLFNKKSA